MNLKFKVGAIALIVASALGLGQNQSALANTKKPPVAPAVKKPAGPVNNCKGTESMFLSVDTKTYVVNICGGDQAHDMVLQKRSDKTVMRYPLSKAEPKMFEASGGGNMYLLTKGTIKGDVFTVTKIVYEELLREPVKGW